MRGSHTVAWQIETTDDLGGRCLCRTFCGVRRGSVFLVATIVLTSTCSSGGEKGAPSSPALSGVTTTISPAAATYLAIANKANSRRQKAEDRYLEDGLVPWALLPASCRESVEMTDDLASELDAATWPGSVKKDVGNLVAALRALAREQLRCANTDPTEAAQKPLVNDLQESKADVAAAISDLRITLGLPPSR